MEIKKLLTDLCSLMSVVGYEYHDGDKLTEIVAPYFDEHEHDSVGNHIFVKRCGKNDAKRLFIDVHYDEVGLMVKGITDGGHLRVCALGGLDSRILPASEVVVYGKETMPGIVLMKSAVTMNMKDKDKLTPVSELLVDVGLAFVNGIGIVSVNVDAKPQILKDDLLVHLHRNAKRLKDAMLIMSTGRCIFVAEVVSVDAELLHPPFFKGCCPPISDNLVRIGSPQPAASVLVR